MENIIISNLCPLVKSTKLYAIWINVTNQLKWPMTNLNYLILQITKYTIQYYSKNIISPKCVYLDALFVSRGTYAHFALSITNEWVTKCRIIGVYL